MGYGFIKVIAGGKHDVVEYLGNKTNIKITSNFDRVYATKTRKYSALKFELSMGKEKYKADLQIRGTTSTDGPYYIRLLLKQK
jgi:hypothetical protein